MNVGSFTLFFTFYTITIKFIVVLMNPNSIPILSIILPFSFIGISILFPVTFSISMHDVTIFQIPYIYVFTPFFFQLLKPFTFYRIDFSFMSFLYFFGYLFFASLNGVNILKILNLLLLYYIVLLRNVN